MSELGSLYQNELVKVFNLMSEEEFKTMKCTFFVGYNPETRKAQTENISLSQFKEIDCDANSYLFKLAAKHAIE